MVGVHPHRRFAVVEYEGQRAALMVDTGSHFTFLSKPSVPWGEMEEDTLTIGCQERTVMAHSFIDLSGETQNAGLPVIGILGSDYFLEKPRRVHFGRDWIRLPADEDREDGLSLPFEDIGGMMFVDVELDRTPILLGVDTGAPHTIWIGEDGQPGDQRQVIGDALGNPVTFFEGSATLGLEGVEFVVPVSRAPHFPIYEENVRIQGIDSRGILGLTSLYLAQSVVFDPESSTLLFEGL